LITVKESKPLIKTLFQNIKYKLGEDDILYSEEPECRPKFPPLTSQNMSPLVMPSSESPAYEEKNPVMSEKTPDGEKC